MPHPPPVIVGPAFTQTAGQAPQRETDPVTALTAEFRALRAELAASAATSLRLQLLVARLQAQEQRVIYFDRLRSEAATRRSTAEQGRNQLASQIQRSNGAETNQLPAEERRAIENHMEQQKSLLALQERTLQQMQVEENDAVTALAQDRAAGTTSTHAWRSWNGR